MKDMTSPAVFRTEQVTKIYTTGAVNVRALDGVDLELFMGELTALLGPSGSGKSTLPNFLGGLDHVTSGRVWFRDTELTGLNDRGLTRYRRDHVGFVFQFYNLVPSLTARENVQLVTDVAHDPMPAEEALTLVGLSARLRSVILLSSIQPSLRLLIQWSLSCWTPVAAFRQMHR